MRGVAACAALLLLAGCAVSVDAPDADAAVRSACKQYVAAVPDRMADQAQRDVDDAERGAAWGDPAIVLTCGVGEPEGFTKVSACQNWNGVDWYVPADEFGDQPGRRHHDHGGPQPADPGAGARGLLAADVGHGRPRGVGEGAHEEDRRLRLSRSGQRRPTVRASASPISRSTSAG